MLKNTLKKLSSSNQAKGNRNPSSKGSKSSKKSKKKNKPKKKEEEEFDMDESNFEDEEFDDEEDFEEDEEFGDDLGDALDDELEDDDSSSGKMAEMETRVKDVENEVGQVSSKLNTIRAENEEMGNKISEMEENIRKLLGIYEMVTEGINPFATETGYGGSEGLGIFSSVSKESKQEDVPEDLTSKDAESFFEDVDDDDEEMESEPEPEPEPEPLESDVTAGKEGESSESSSGEAPEDMFERLKQENGEDQGSSDTKGTKAEEINFEEPEMVDEWSEDEYEDESQVGIEHVHPSETSGNVQEAVNETRAHAGKLPKSSSSPYLKDIPKDLISDVIALKWMDYLVNTFGIKRMADILDFYVDIGWISKNVKDLLINYSRGYVLREGHIIEEPETPTLRDHFKSLIFISKLSGHDLNLEEVERLIKDVEELEKDVNDVITEHAFGSNC